MYINHLITRGPLPAGVGLSKGLCNLGPDPKFNSQMLRFQKCVQVLNTHNH